MIDPTEPYQGHRYFGKYKGFVRRNNDPEGRFRLQCYCPQVMGPADDERHWLGWATPNLPWLGGLPAIHGGPPKTRDQTGGVDIVGVWIEFEGGRIDFPIWTGTWLVAPTPTSPGAQLPLDEAAGLVGGSIIENPPAGSEVDDINPPEPNPDAEEIRIVVKEGQEIVLGAQNGGYILIGPYGISITGINVMINGRLMTAATADKVVG